MVWYSNLHYTLVIEVNKITFMTFCCFNYLKNSKDRRVIVEIQTKFEKLMGSKLYADN